MTIKKKIFVTNTVMILVSLLVLLGIGSLLLTIFQHTYLGHQSENSQLSTHTAQIQQIMEEEQGYGTDWQKWASELEVYDFRLGVLDDDGQTIYSNLNKNETESVQSIWERGGTSAVQEQHHGHDHAEAVTVNTFFLNNATVLSASFSDGDAVYHFYAASSAEGESILGTDKSVFQLFLLLFVIVGIIVILAILFCSRIFTKRLVGQIMEPVDQLTEAAERIDRGDLTQPVKYERRDEFRNVCDSFNQMQDHLKEGMDKNAAYEKARTEMISGISHDLRTPLTSVKGYIKGLQDGVAGTEEKRQEYLRIAYSCACDMEKLLSKLFYFSKLETGNMPFYKQRTDMKEYLTDYVDGKRDELTVKGAVLEISEGGGGSCFLDIDQEQMKRVFDNFVENSLKYADVKPLVMKLSLEEEPDGGLTITFSDNGKGVEEEKLAFLFEQFYRGDESRSDGDGSGLGLYVCQYIVKAHGGTIRAENRDGLQIIMSFRERKGEA